MISAVTIWKRTAFTKYKSDIENRLSVNRFNLSYKFQQLVDAVVNSFPVDSKYDEYLDVAYYDIHEVVENHVRDVIEAREERDREDSGTVE